MQFNFYVGHTLVMSLDIIDGVTCNCVVYHDVAALAILEPTERHEVGLQNKLQKIFNTKLPLKQIVKEYDLTRFPYVAWHSVSIVVKNSHAS